MRFTKANQGLMIGWAQDRILRSTGSIGIRRTKPLKTVLLAAGLPSTSLKRGTPLKQGVNENCARFGRILFSALAGLMLALARQPVCAQSEGGQSFSRQAMLGDLARNCIVPGYQRLAAKCRELTNAIGQLAAAPGQEAFEKALEAWVGASLAASAVRCVEVGPMSQPEYGPNFYFFQIMPNAIENKIGSSNAIDESLVEEMGATTKALFAMEYLLYGSTGGPNAPAGRVEPARERLLAPEAGRRRQYLMVLAKDLEAKAEELAKHWAAPGKEGASAKFVEGGQQSLNQLVNGVAEALEDVAYRHIHFALGLAKPLEGQIYRLERSPSGTSLENLVAILQSAHKLYRNSAGFGLADAVREVNGPVAAALETHFEQALAATRAMGVPLDKAILDKRAAVEAAYEKDHTLEVKFKVDLVSALGVTLTFSSADGD